MSGVFGLVNRFFDLVFSAFEGTSPVPLLLATSAGTGLLLILIFRYTSNQAQMRRARDGLQAHVLEVRLFQDQLAVVMRAYARIALGILRFLRLSLKPMAVMFVPLALIAIQLDRRLGQTPLRPNQAFLIKARLDDASLLDHIFLRLPGGLAVTAPPVHIPEEKEIDWRVTAEKYGNYSVEIVVSDQAFSKLKTVTVSDHITRLSPRRMRDHFFSWVLHSSEPQLPAAGPLGAIEVTYPHRELDLGFFQSSWIIPFFVFSFGAAWVLKFVLRVEI